MGLWLPFALPNPPPLSLPRGAVMVAAGSEHHRAGHEDPGEGHEGGHGYLPAHRHHCQAVRRGAAAELRGHDQDVSGEMRLSQAQQPALGSGVPKGGRRDSNRTPLGETLGHPAPYSSWSLALGLSWVLCFGSIRQKGTERSPRAPNVASSVSRPLDLLPIGCVGP